MRMKRFLIMLALLTTAATSLWAQTYKVKMKNGTPDVSNWTITPPEASTTGVTMGSRVEVNYSGERRVKRALAKYWRSIKMLKAMPLYRQPLASSSVATAWHTPPPTRSDCPRALPPQL